MPCGIQPRYLERQHLIKLALGGQLRNFFMRMHPFHRQAEEVERQAGQENTRLPADFDYAAVRGLTREAQSKLSAQRPETLGQAARIQGITPATIALLMVYLKKRSMPGAGPSAERGTGQRADIEPPITKPGIAA